MNIEQEDYLSKENHEDIYQAMLSHAEEDIKMMYPKKSRRAFIRSAFTFGAALGFGAGIAELGTPSAFADGDDEEDPTTGLCIVAAKICGACKEGCLGCNDGCVLSCKVGCFAGCKTSCFGVFVCVGGHNSTEA